MSNGQSQKKIVRLGKLVLASPLLLPFLTFIGLLRALNEGLTRTVGRAVVICPHCGAPGVVESRHPKVIR